MRRAVIALLVLPGLAGAAAAQQAFPAPGDDAVLTLGGGPKLQPEYEGSKNYIVAPFPIASLRFMVNPFTGAPSSDFGWGVAPAFRYIGKRDASVDRKLKGLDRVDAAFEAGITVDYTTQFARGFVEIRQGFGGHSGQILDFGADAILRPTPDLKVSVGPRLSFATEDYMSTYFGVSKKEAKKSVYSAFNADGGLRAWGAATRVDWDVTPQWLIRLDAGWNRLSGDAGDSPIVRKTGDRNQFTLGLGAAYRFGIDYR